MSAAGHLVLSPNEEAALRERIVREKRLERLRQVREREREVARRKRRALKGEMAGAQQRDREGIMVLLL